MKENVLGNFFCNPPFGFWENWKERKIRNAVLYLVLGSEECGSSLVSLDKCVFVGSVVCDIQNFVSFPLLLLSNQTEV